MTYIHTYIHTCIFIDYLRTYIHGRSLCGGIDKLVIMTGWFGRIGIVELTPALYTRGWIRDILAAGEIHHLGLSDNLKCLPPN